MLLAKSVVLKSVFADPSEIGDKKKVAREVARALNLKRGRVLNLLKTHKKFVWIARKVGDKEAYLLKRQGIRGIYLTEEPARVYPQGEMAGQLLGFVGVDNHGLEGLEKSFDSYLSGKKRYFWIQRDGKGHILYAPGELQRGSPGKDLILSLDARIQSITEYALAKGVIENQARWGGALVVDVPTGEILAWAQYPFFNPNDYRRSSSSIWRDRIALDQFEPGSTVKPLVVASALQQKIIKPSTLIFCENGKWKFEDIILKDTHRHKWLTVSKIVRYSSNIGAAKIAIGLGARQLYEYFSTLGFGRPLGMPLPGEAKGSLRPYSSWGPVDLATAAFGQGFSVTMLQLAQAYNCLANLGVKVPLHITLIPPQNGPAPTRIFSREVALGVLKMLRDVVEKDGTGTLARIKGVEIGGKTGTSQKAGPEGGYSRDKYVASFVGLMPALSPRFLALVVIDEPKKDIYGGVVAAPVVKHIFEHILAYKGPIPMSRTHPSPGSLPLGSQKGKDSLPRATSISRVPDFKGMCLRQALDILAKKHIVPHIEGKGIWVVGQSPPPGSRWSSSVTLRLKGEGDNSAHNNR